MEKLFTKVAGRIATWSGRPVTFILAIALIAAWGLSGPVFGYSDTWQLVINTGTTIITFLMVFLIQNSQNRDAAAMQAKLDELIRAVDKARGEFIGVEHLTDRQIDAIRTALEQECREEPDRHRGKEGTAHHSVERLQGRRL